MNCNRDAECKSGSCYDGVCIVPRDLDAECDSDADCNSGTCGESSYEDHDAWERCHADNVALRSGFTVDKIDPNSVCKAPSYCESKYENGSECYQDSNCKSGYCNKRLGTCGVPRTE